MKKIYFLLLFFWSGINPVFAQEVYQAHTHVQLVSEKDTVFPAGVFWVGLDLKMDDGWHVYWQNPGDAGLAPKIKWDLPVGINAQGILWPYPQRLNQGPLTNYGYEHEVLLLVPMHIDGNLQSSKVINLQSKVSWLTCDKEECIPGKAQLDLSLPVVTDYSKIKVTRFKNLFDQTSLNLPRGLRLVFSHAVLDGNQWRIDIQTPWRHKGDIIFFPFRNDVIEHAAAQQTQITDKGYQVTLTKSHLLQGPLPLLEGVAVNPAAWDDKGILKAIIIHAPIEPAPVQVAPQQVAPRQVVPQEVAHQQAEVPFWVACLLAFIGGLILNLMPCVLPVLSIKVLHLVERHPDRKVALSHSLIYALGILVSVWALAILLFILKAAGQFSGWGFQFQSPVFVLAVAVILFLLALNLFGVFHFGPLMSGLPMGQAGYQASFISGVVTTVVASPCTAPFMGTALTVAISQPGIIGFGIFTALGLGLALPFVLLSTFPFLLSFVPKPGPWMVHLKQFLGLILLACVIWFLGVFGIQTGLVDLSKVNKSSNDMHWQNYSSTAVDQARQTGYGVFIDFTAAWCINCQVNDRLVLQNQEVVSAFKGKGIIAFKGDWTKYDPAITQALATFGRDSIPVYVYYPPGANAPIILPQIITPKIILDRIKQ